MSSIDRDRPQERPHRRRFAALIAASVLSAGPPGEASQSGRDGFSGNPATNGGAVCTVCHGPGGAAVPLVAVTGPGQVSAGGFADYTVTLSGGAAVTGGVGLSIADPSGRPVGTLTPLDSDLQRLGAELSHRVPKHFSGGATSFRFRFAAPNYDVQATLYVAGNSTNGALDLLGDGIDSGTWPIAVVDGIEPPPPPPPPPDDSELIAEVFASGLVAPVAIAQVGDGRLFVVEQPGRIRIVQPNGSVLAAPFLDIESRVDDSGSEMGLLGLAFHPDYGSNGYFYVYYTRDGAGALDRSRVSRFRVSGSPNLADPNSEQILLEFEQPYANHNGGDLHFGPDGYLYIASGDGGSGGDPQDNAQNPSRLLGKILRIDVDGGGGDPDCDISGAGNYGTPPGNAFGDGPGGAGCDEVYVLGARNPWRFSFDPATGDLWIGDVGQGSVEEIDRIPGGSPGGINLGWRCYEGSQPYNLTGCDPSPAYLFPVHDYSHADGNCSVTGGLVYRGGLDPALAGQYFFSDFCHGSIRAIAGPPGGETVREVLPANIVVAPSAFGVDSAGEMLVASLSGGALYRLRPAGSPGDGDADDDGIPDPEDPDDDNDGIADWADPGPFDPAIGLAPVRPAAATAQVNHQWTQVSAPSGFLGAVVIAGPPSSQDPHPGVVRLRNVSDRGFELRFKEWDYRARNFADTTHGTETIPYAVLKPGRHTLSDGSIWQVGSFALGGTGVYSAVSFGQGFSAAPRLFLTVQTQNGGQAVTARARNLTASGFQAALFEEEALMDGHGPETVGYLAIYSPAGGGTLALDGAQVAYQMQSVAVNQSWTAALGRQIRLEEEQSRDAETNHAPETVHCLALGSQYLAQQVTQGGRDTTALRRTD